MTTVSDIGVGRKTSGPVDSNQMAEIRHLNAALLVTNDPRFPFDEVAILQVETERSTAPEPVGSSRPRPVAAQAAGLTEPPPPGPRLGRLHGLLHRAISAQTVSQAAPRQSDIARAREALEQGDLPAARELFERVITREPANADAWLGLAQAQFLEGNAVDAHAALDQVFLLRPTSNKGFMLRARIHRSEGEFEKARIHRSEGEFEKARIHRSEGEFEKAREYYWKLVAKNLTEVPVLIDVLHEIEDMGFHRDTLLIADAILEIDITNQTALAARENALKQGAM